MRDLYFEINEQCSPSPASLGDAGDWLADTVVSSGRIAPRC